MRLFVIAALLPAVSAFVANPSINVAARASSTSLADAAAPVELTIDMPPSGSNLQANLKIPPLLSVPSEIIQVRYKLPFGLDVEPKNNLAVVTKDGPGGEKVGDVLRYTSQWAIGLPQGGGIMASAMAFSGGASWQCSLFNVVKAESWDQVVEALVSNDPVRLLILT